MSQIIDTFRALTSTPENTATIAPTPTLTPIPILGIDEPIVVNEISVQVLVVEWKNPNVVTGFNLQSGYKSLMVKVELRGTEASAADLLNKLDFRKMVVFDENNNESPIVFFNMPVSSLTGSDVTQLELFFAVLETATQHSIRFVDGQVIDLAPLLPPE
ncbi:MAG: hypothetical protein HY867_05180 [Chloroflexi bacterium]|nr:hypothetical protein [Chloroflexota bacterium]